MAESKQGSAGMGKRVSLISSLVVLVLSFAAGIWMVGSILEGFGTDAYLAPIRLATQIILQMPPFAIVIIVLLHIMIVALLIRTLAVPRLRQSNLWYVLPCVILLVALYWYLSSRGVVTMIERMTQ